MRQVPGRYHSRMRCKCRQIAGLPGDRKTSHATPLISDDDDDDDGADDGHDDGDGDDADAYVGNDDGEISSSAARPGEVVMVRVMMVAMVVRL